MGRQPLPFLWFSLAFLGGIWLAWAVAWPWTAWLGLAALPPLLAWALSRPAWGERLRAVFHSLPRLGLAPGVLWIAFFAGALRCQLAQPNLTPNHIAAYNDRGMVLITGVVVAPPEQRDSATQVRVRVEQIALQQGEVFGAPTPVHGLLLARLPIGLQPRYGDRLALTGRPQTPPELADFSYREYLARQGVYAYLPYARAEIVAPDQGSPLLGAVFALRERLLQGIARVFPPDEAALLDGILLGDEGRIPAALDQAFTQTGTAHIIAISGFNIAILAALFSRLFTRLLGRWRGALAAALAIAFYTLLVGASASVVRAAIMGGVGLLGRQIGRRQHGINTLAFTALVMCLAQPQALWDAGFQLSFFATLGLVLYAAPLEAGFTRLVARAVPGPLAARLARPAGEYLLFTLAAQITTLPIVALHFGRVSLIALLANPLVLPPQPLVMVLGGLAALLTLVSPLLGQLAAWLAWPFVAYTLRVVELLARVPGGSFEIGPLGWGWALLFYAALFGLTFARPLVVRLRPLLRPGAVMLALGALACLLWQAALARPDGRLRLTLLPGETGQAVLLQTPSGRALLVGGQPGASALLSSLGRRLPLFHPGLDALVVTGSRAADTGGLTAVAKRYPPDLVLWSAPQPAAQAAQGLAADLERTAVPVIPAVAGQTLDLGDGAALRVMDCAAESPCLLLEWRAFRALWLPEGALYPAALSAVTVLIAPGALGDPPADPPWLLWSGETAAKGWVQVTTDGERFWARAERP